MKIRTLGGLFAALTFTSMIQPVAAAPGDAFVAGSRSGPFVVTEKTLTNLLSDGYEIRGNLGTALVLQKAASVYSCQIPPDPEHLSYQPYFVCSELRELRTGAMPDKTMPEMEKLKPMPGGKQPSTQP